MKITEFENSRFVTSLEQSVLIQAWGIGAFADKQYIVLDNDTEEEVCYEDAMKNCKGFHCKIADIEEKSKHGVPAWTLSASMGMLSFYGLYTISYIPDKWRNKDDEFPFKCKFQYLLWEYKAFYGEGGTEIDAIMNALTKSFKTLNKTTLK
jgi:hypothetical protein